MLSHAVKAGLAVHRCESIPRMATSYGPNSTETPGDNPVSSRCAPNRYRWPVAGNLARSSSNATLFL
jgi:hypothetical protein